MFQDQKKIKLTPTQARKKIEWYCAYQERCHSEVRERLFSYGLFTKEVDEIVAHLVINNFLNEERFAEAYASGKFRMKHWGKIKIKAGLKQKRISDYCIKKGLAAIDGDEYLEVLKKEKEKKNKSIKDTAGISKEKKTFQRKYKLISYLVGRGFEGDLVKETVGEILK